MANTHKVIRSFHAETMRNPGDLVDASEWKNAKALEDQRYIEPINTDTPYVGGAGPSPDPKLIQESLARKERSKNSDSGGIASMAEAEESLAGEKTEESSTLRGKLPDSIPGHAALEAEGITTYAQLRKRMDEGTLTEISGIGDATAAKIQEAVSEAGEATK